MLVRRMQTISFFPTKIINYMRGISDAYSIYTNQRPNIIHLTISECFGQLLKP